jgi:hypothetical protein
LTVLVLKRSKRKEEKNERFRKYRISHFWLQTRRERNWGGRSVVTISVCECGEGHLGALSIHGRRSYTHRRRSISIGRDIRRFGRCKTHLES